MAMPLTVLRFSPGICDRLSRPVWVSGQLKRPQICFNVSSGFATKSIGRTECPSGITIQIDHRMPDRDNPTTRHDYICWGGGCDIQEGAAIPLSIQLLLNSHNRNPNDLCVSLTGPYYFLCGQAAYRIIPPNARGSCSLVRLVPASYIADGHEDLMVQRRVSMGRRTKRELFSTGDRAWAWFPAWTGWGIELMKRLNKFSTIVDEMFNETVEAMREVSSEQRQLKTLLLQEKMALDYLLAAKGGFCEFIGEDCCTWVEDTGDKVQAHLDKVKMLQGQARAIANEGWNPFKSLGSFGDVLFSIGSWLREVGVYILMLFLFLFILYILARCSCCLIKRVAQARADDHILVAAPRYAMDQPIPLLERMSP